MELTVNDQVIKKPAADDIVHALDATSFPEDWSIVLENDAGDALDARAQPDNTFTLAHVDSSHRRRNAVPAVDAARLKSICLKFLSGDQWQGECTWQNEKPARAAPKQGAKMKFVPDTRPLVGRSGEPPEWAKGILVGIIGLVALIFTIGQWNYSFLRSLIPFADSHYFWVGLIALPMVALVAVAAATKMVELRQASSWTQTTGRIMRSEIEARHHRFGNDAETVKNVPAVEYEFKAGARTVRGSRIGIGDDAGRANTEATLARYPVGAQVAVFYDPEDPKNCVLERGVPQGVTAQGCLGALAVLAAFGGAIYWLVTRGPAFVRANFPNASVNPEFPLFATGFGLFLLLFFIGMRRISQLAANWPSVRGKIVRSEVESYQERMSDRSSGTTTMYRPVVEFAYPVRGREYRSNQIKLMTVVSGAQNYAEKVVKKYPKGRGVTVHYDPANPNTAALENPTGLAWYPLALALGCFALAAWQLGVFK
jgi:hypothetical protein